MSILKKNLIFQVECAIHITDDDSPLVHLGNSETWKTIRNAAAIRDRDVRKMASEDGYPSIYYHRRCYQSFAGKGKIRPLNIVLHNELYMRAFAALGSENEISEEYRDILKRFVCEMYGCKTKGSDKPDINKLRYLMYCQKRGKVSYDSLPPCRNVLWHHVSRANYQVGIWRKSLQPFMESQCPTSCSGWCWDDGMLDVKWMSCKKFSN